VFQQNRPYPANHPAVYRNTVANDHDAHRLGEAYVGPLKAYSKYRVGDCRLVCEIQDKARTILGVANGERKEVYR
jgi:mRNA interferase RelE/StbE